jgi:glutaredoxin
MIKLFEDRGISFEYFDIESLPNEERLSIKKEARLFGLKSFPIIKIADNQLVRNEDIISKIQGELNENN